MQRSRTEVPALDLRPPVRLDGWAITLAGGIAGGTVVPPLAPMLVVASAIVSVGTLLWRNLVPAEWRLMAILGPLFVVGGSGSPPYTPPRPTYWRSWRSSSRAR